MSDYVHEPEGIEKLMPWSDKVEEILRNRHKGKLSKTSMEIQRSLGS